MAEEENSFVVVVDKGTILIPLINVINLPFMK